MICDFCLFYSYFAKFVDIAGKKKKKQGMTGSYESD